MLLPSVPTPLALVRAAWPYLLLTVPTVPSPHTCPVPNSTSNPGGHLHVCWRTHLQAVQTSLRKPRGKKGPSDNQRRVPADLVHIIPPNMTGIMTSVNDFLLEGLWKV